MLSVDLIDYTEQRMSESYSIQENGIPERISDGPRSEFSRRYLSEQLDMDQFAEAIRQLLANPSAMTVPPPIVYGR